MTITGNVSKANRPNGQGTYYVLSTESGLEFALSMTESFSTKDDAKVLEPMLGKKVEADGLLQKSTGSFLAFGVKEA